LVFDFQFLTSSKNFLINNLISTGYLKTPRIIEAFEKIDRADFVPDDLKSEAYANSPLPIGYGQTISQPLTVAFMLELLQPEEGDRILDVGFGSGWTTALLAEITGRKGKVFGVERVPELCEFGRNNVSKYDFVKQSRVKMKCADGAIGWSEEAPFDRILASASAKELPGEWEKQIKTGGRIVAPIAWSIWLFIRKGGGKFEKTEFPGFSFVPLISG
jgi:protein-L-isoaspartate(D-aspartate) O-methyltransferase